MDSRFNRIAAPVDFDGQRARPCHPLVTAEILQGQHPQRSWEYSLALWALEATIQDACYDPGDGIDPLTQLPLPFTYVEIGGSGSNFWQTLRHYTSKLGFSIDPNHEWPDPSQSALYFRDTLAQFRAEHPQSPQAAAVFALSVIEHVPDAELGGFLEDLCWLTAPGGLLFLTTDVGPEQPDRYHFNWMRERIYTPEDLADLGSSLYNRGFVPLREIDIRWDGPTVYDYSVGALALTRRYA